MRRVQHLSMSGFQGNLQALSGAIEVQCGSSMRQRAHGMRSNSNNRFGHRHVGVGAFCLWWHGVGRLMQHLYGVKCNCQTMSITDYCWRSFSTSTVTCHILLHVTRVGNNHVTSYFLSSSDSQHSIMAKESLWLKHFSACSKIKQPTHCNTRNRRMDLQPYSV